MALYLVDYILQQKVIRTISHWQLYTVPKREQVNYLREMGSEDQWISAGFMGTLQGSGEFHHEALKFFKMYLK